MMIRLGFGDLWIRKIMKYICSVSYSFLHNGQVFGEVVPHRGVRQRDPISPYICIMCVEGLSTIFRRNEEVGLLHRCKIAKDAFVISHFLFADGCYFLQGGGSGSECDEKHSCKI